MIELLSRHPDILGEPKGLIVEPLPVDEETSSLSAIIMDDDFYHFTIQHSKLTNGLRHADSAALIALKHVLTSIFCKTKLTESMSIVKTSRSIGLMC